MPSKPRDPVETYAREVCAKRFVTGRLVRLACERHLKDLRSGPARGLKWDREAATRAIEFFPAVLRHSKGAFAGQPFALLPWQQFVIGSIFGWKLLIEDGRYIRRFRTAFVSTARKNGSQRLKRALV